MTPLNEVRNIWAVGRNYSEHAKELGNKAPSAEGEPLIFLKAGSSLVENGRKFRLPKFTNDVHFETELVFQFGGAADKLELTAVTLGIDLTAREVQTRLKNHGHPWTLAKSFRDSALIGPLTALPAGFDPQKVEFTLKVNGELRQHGRSAEMIFSVAKQKAYILERFPVVAGDLLMTGTPSGVGALKSGDHLEAEIPGLLKCSWTAS